PYPTTEPTCPIVPVDRYTAPPPPLSFPTRRSPDLPTSGSTFAIGATTATTTTVTCTATDAHGNTGSASFNVTVQDKTAPVLTVPNQKSTHLNSSHVATANDTS